MMARKVCWLELKDLASEASSNLYMEKQKHVCLRNWEFIVLSKQQVEYACIDTYSSYKIGHKLLVEN
ncbi:hypothetical protein RJ641_001583 [Dillenia turbinata]|uniref:Uncharacterized protein n=1 Tax=Dillenia turbinata TaxID=194707 RepID=A0AAN8VEC4_9MAGN